MTDWQLVWLGTIAIAVAVMAALQVAALSVLIRMVLQAVKAIQKLDRDLTPLLEKAHRIADDAARTSALAAAQAERIDALVTSATERVDETLDDDRGHGGRVGERGVPGGRGHAGHVDVVLDRERRPGERARGRHRPRRRDPGDPHRPVA